MICPNGHLEVKKNGTYTHVNGTSQRFYCSVCRITWSEFGKQMNRLPVKKRELAEQAFRSGFSHRKVALIAGISTETARSISRRIGIIYPPRPMGKRNRRDYLITYWKTHKVNIERNDTVRASIALWLAKNVKPLSKEQIFAAMLPQFPHLKNYSVTNILRTDADHCFKRIGDKFTFEPSPFYSPIMSYREGKPISKYRQLMDAAHAVWFQVRGLRDKDAEEFIETLKKRNEEFIHRKHIEAIRKTQPLLQLMATAAAINKTNETNNTERS